MAAGEVTATASAMATVAGRGPARAQRAAGRCGQSGSAAGAMTDNGREVFGATRERQAGGGRRR